jgi:O-methyltransferase domain
VADHPELTAPFDQAMATFAPWTAAVLTAAIDFSAFRKIADIGGGNGSLLIGILKACPGLSGIVFDQPHTAARARAQVAVAGLTGRCEVIAGSFFDALPGEQMPTCSAACLWTGTTSARPRSCGTAAPPCLHTDRSVEAIYPARVDPSEECRSVAATDLLMLVCTGGRQRSEAEFRALPAASGFRLSRVVTPARGVSVVQGEAV